MKRLVLHIRASNFFGGPERQVVGHIKASVHFRHQVLALVDGAGENALAVACKEEDIPVEVLAKRGAYSPSWVFSLRRSFRDLKPDIICCHGYRPLILTLIAGIGLGLPILAFARGHTEEDVKVRIFQWLELLAFRFAEAVVAVSQGYADYIERKGVPKGKIRVVHNAIDVEAFRGPTDSEPDALHDIGVWPSGFLIATVGRLSPEKGQADLLRAFSSVHRRFPGTSLLIVGDGPSRPYLEALVGEDRNEGVHFVGFRKDVAKILRCIDLFVLPSHTEGLPNVLLEAFACSKPAVATDVGGVSEIIEQGINGFLVPPSRPDLLAGAIERCLENAEFARRMGEIGYCKVRSGFTFKGQNVKLEKIYDTILSNRSVPCLTCPS